LYLQLGMGDSNDTLQAREVVGVVSDVKQDALSETLPTLYVSAEQTQLYGAAFVVRARGDVTVLIPALKETIHAMDPRVPLVSPRTLHEVLSDLVRRQTLAMILIGMFAALALLLAGLGVYGIMAYSVVARTREFGVRAALGATRRAILLLVLRQGVATIVGGVVAGLLVAAVLTKLIASLLVGVTTHDVLSFVVASVVLVVAALAACIVPARAATRVSPVEALRGD
jgi:ABC-type antimicrobial peptide transport system permease subunit